MHAHHRIHRVFRSEAASQGNTTRRNLKSFGCWMYTSLKRGSSHPRQFVKMFRGMTHVAEVVYEGNLNKQFIADVSEGKYPVYEGVVAKGDDFMVKIKTGAYFKKLNEVYGTEYRHYWE
jgi:hypothetical protein